jgi:hypothetical protein
MKNFLFAIAIIAFSATSTQAQTISFGLKGGMTASNMKMSRGAFSIPSKTKIAFYAGAVAEAPVSEKFAVQPELFYTSMGAKMHVIVSDGGYNVTENLGYLNLPLLVKYKVEGFSVFAGPQVSYLLSARSKGSQSNINNNDQYKRMEVAGVLGVGYTLPNGFGIDGRYQIDLTNVVKAPREADATDKNSAFTVGLHYFFNR